VIYHEIIKVHCSFFLLCTCKICERHAQIMRVEIFVMYAL